ncbi:MAG: hypothetical protein WD691_09070, partial [Acidimicrobiales bacterium]
AGLVDDEPFLGGEVVFGARALAAVEVMFARHLLDAWSQGRSSLLTVRAQRAGKQHDHETAR